MITAEDYYYTLIDIVLCHKYGSLQFNQYRMNCIQDKVRGLLEIDRTALLSYLRGDVETCPQIDRAMADSFVLPEKAVAKTPRGKEDQLTQVYKKRKVDDLLSASVSSAVATAAEDDPLSRLRTRFFPLWPNKNSALNAPPSTELSSVLRVFNQTVLQSLQKEKDRDSGALAVSAVPASQSSSAPSIPTGRPIIVVPAALTSAINMTNVKAFLEEGKYIKPSQGAMQRRKDVIQRKVDTGEAKVAIVYTVLDDPTVLSKEDWQRVVAVFVTGQTWQFNRWPEGYREPVELFSQVLGVHIAIEGRPVDSGVLSWNCKVLKVHENRDYVNAGTMSQFWMFVDDYIKKHKPHLIPKSSQG